MSLKRLWLYFQMSALLDSSELPQELKYYLPLFCEVVFESPVMRNGGNYYVDTKTVLVCQVLYKLLQMSLMIGGRGLFDADFDPIPSPVAQWYSA